MEDYIGIDIGLSNFNFNRLPKFVKIHETQQKSRKESFSEKYKDKYINDTLLIFSKKEKNSKLNELINIIIDFRKKCINQEDKEDNNKVRNILTENYLFFHDVEKSLIEISYLTQKELRDKKIEELYSWYKNIINKNTMLKRIKSKSYQVPKAKYDISEGEQINEDNKDNIDNNNIIEKKELTRNYRLRLSSAKIQNSDLTVNTKNNFSWNFVTRLYIKRKCTNNRNYPRTNSEIISSSFITPKQSKTIKPIFFPKIEKNMQSLENAINNSKLKIIREKRNLEEVNTNLNLFGKSRAKFKENINNKYEMKELIKYYVNENKNKNETDINNSPLLKKYLNKKIKIRRPEVEVNKYNLFNNNNNGGNIDNNIYKKKSNKKIIKVETKLVKNISKKKARIFFGINHTKIIVDNIKNINKENKIINNNKDNIVSFNIKLKVFGNNYKINNLFAKNLEDENSIIKKTSKQLFSSDLLFKEKFLNQNKSFDLVFKKENNYKTDLNNSIENYEEEEDEENLKEKNEEEYDIEKFYKSHEEEQNKRIYFNLSLFHKNNINKINFNKRIKNLNILCKYKYPINLNEKKKLEIYTNYHNNKSDLLSIRKKMYIFNKIDFNQISTKNTNNIFRNSFRYDNIDDDYNNKEEEYNKKNENILNKKLSLSEALFEPKNNRLHSLYYLPRTGSNLLIRK